MNQKLERRQSFRLASKKSNLCPTPPLASVMTRGASFTMKGKTVSDFFEVPKEIQRVASTTSSNPRNNQRRTAFAAHRSKSTINPRSTRISERSEKHESPEPGFARPMTRSVRSRISLADQQSHGVCSSTAKARSNLANRSSQAGSQGRKRD